MDDRARIYRAQILRAVLGPKWNELKAHDLTRLNQIAEHLVDCEDARSILRNKGHGTVDMTFAEMAASVPGNVRRVLDRLFSRSPRP